jgi:hypothetical protein
MPVDMVSAETGQTEQVPDNEVQARFQSKKWGFVKGSQLPVITPKGTIGLIPVEKASDAFRRQIKPVPYETYQKADDEAKYGGIGGAAIAAAEAIPRGATGGLSDPAAIAAAKLIGGPEAAKATREHLAGYKRTHGLVAGAGEVVGAIGPSLLAGPLGAAGEVAEGARAAEAVAEAGQAVKASGLAKEAVGLAGLPSRAVGAAGRLGERVGASLAGTEATSLLGRAAQGAVRHGLAAGAEGALFGAGNEISEAALGDHKLTAEKLFAAAGHGAVMGTLFGAGLGAAGAVGKVGVEKMGEFFSPKAADMAGEQAWRSLNPGKTASAEVKAFAGGTSAAGKTYLKYGILDGGLEEIVPRIETAAQNVGKKIGTILRETPADNIPLNEALRPFNEAIARHADNLGHENIANSLIKLRDEAIQLFTGKPALEAGLVVPTKPIRFLDFVKQRQSLGQVSFEGNLTAAQTILTNEKRRIYHAMAEMQNDAIDTAAKALKAVGAGDGLAAKQLKELNREYQHLTIGEQAAKRNAAAIMGNQNLSLTSKMAGIAMGAVGIGAGQPLAIAKGVGTAMATQFIQRRGNIWAAKALDKLSTIGAMSRTIAKVDGEMDSAVASFMKRSEGIETRKIPRAHPFRHEEEGTQEERYQKTVNKINGMRQPDLQVAEQNATKLARHTPNVSTALTATAQLATAYLATKIPPSNIDPHSPTLHLEKPRTSDFQKEEFLRYADAVEEGPMKLAKEMKEGHIRRETIEAIKAVYPETFKDFQSRLTAALADSKHKLDYDTRTQLGILFGIPADSSQEPAFVRAQQNTFAQSKQAQQAPPSAPTGKKAINPTKAAAGMALPLQTGPAI